MIAHSTQSVPAIDWVGIDVAKRTFTAALARAGQKWPLTALRELPVKQFTRSRDGVDALAAWLNTLVEPKPEGIAIGIVMESTGNYSMELAVWIYERQPHFRPAIVNAQQTHAYINSMNVRGKTDAIEARALAFYGIEREPAAYEPLRPEQRCLRDLARHRAHLVQQNLAIANRKEEGAESKFVRQAQKRLVQVFEREIAKAEEQMREIVKNDTRLKRDIGLLCTIYGVAFLTAATVLAELGDLRRFERARQLSAFAGLNPRQAQSGSSLNKPAHLSKRGNSRVRKALYMAALTAIHDKGPMQRTYENLCAQGRPKMVALGAVMRKLLVLMRAILISEQPYSRMWINQHQRHTQAAFA